MAIKNQGILNCSFLSVKNRKKCSDFLDNQQMDMVIKILEKYKLEVTDISTIDLLISEAQRSQKQSDYLAPLKNPLKILGTIILPIVVYVAQKIGDASTHEEMFTMAIQVIIIVILVFTLIFTLSEIIKEIFYRDYNKYNEFISDLNQLKIFYSKKNTSDK